MRKTVLKIIRTRRNVESADTLCPLSQGAPILGGALKEFLGMPHLVCLWAGTKLEEPAPLHGRRCSIPGDAVLVVFLFFAIALG